MRYSVTILVVVLFGLSGCSSQKKLVKQAPFIVEKPTCTPFDGGRETSGSGFTLRLPVSLQTGDELVFEKVFFRGHVLDSKLVTEDGMQYLQCKYKREVKQKPDIVMHDNPIMEVGNQPPAEIREKEDYPFKLNPDEAVISYLHKGKTRFAKISGVKDKSPVIFPGRE
ncbi:MAG: hypothetical protein R3356_04045 [Eudoraea sp.]|nr:hypothetical protein [Eudoraea sp.]